VNIKAGLLNNLDFQLLFTSYRTEKTEDLETGTIRRKSGFDGITHDSNSTSVATTAVFSRWDSSHLLNCPSIRII